MSKVEESKILAQRILMLEKENKKTIINVLNAFVISETAMKLGVEPSALKEVIKN